MRSVVYTLDLCESCVQLTIHSTYASHASIDYTLTLAYMRVFRDIDFFSKEQVLRKWS